MKFGNDGEWYEQSAMEIISPSGERMPVMVYDQACWTCYDITSWLNVPRGQSYCLRCERLEADVYIFIAS